MLQGIAGCVKWAPVQSSVKQEQKVIKPLWDPATSLHIFGGAGLDLRVPFSEYPSTPTDRVIRYLVSTLFIPPNLNENMCIYIGLIYVEST